MRRVPYPGNVDALPVAPVLITGGAGFIGTNLAHRLLDQQRHVIVLDNLSRPGVERNLETLCRHPRAHDRLQIIRGDVRDPAAVQPLVERAAAIFHFASQVAVTTSLAQPMQDFEINARGTLNLLEAMRHCRTDAPILYTSTNKVYGSLQHIALTRRGSRYRPLDPHIERTGLAENSLDFHSPYGCSKGAAEQYVLDYTRSFGIQGVVFRMSCIYGPHQCGNEDQGWVAHFIQSVVNQQPIRLYGNGRQVRDLLYVDDLVAAMLLAVQQIDRLAGRAFNIGGGPDNTVSLLELMSLLRHLNGRCPPITFDNWRPGDQRYYVSNIQSFASLTNWRPRVRVPQGITRLYDWIQREQHPQYATTAP